MNLRWLCVPVFGVVLDVAAKSAPAQDNCFDYCAYSCPTEEDLRSACTDNCSVRCSAGGDLAKSWNSSSAAPYGAIAYGKDSGAYGFAYNQKSASKAGQMALSKCAVHGGDCAIVVRLTHSCGAVAAAANGGFAGGQGATRDKAETKALANCAQNAGGSCEIQVWTCSP